MRGGGRQSAAHDTAAWPEGRQCQWEPEVGNDTLVGRTRPKGRAERAGFDGSEGETKMGRVTKRAESQGRCSINSFFILNRILDSKIKGLKYLWIEFELKSNWDKLE
jgi:hypothetical protein